MNGILYLIQVNLYLMVFYAFYRLLLSKETFFALNRGYLIGSTLLSFCIPVLQSDWIKELFLSEQIQQPASQFNLQAYEFLFVPQAKVETLTLGELLCWIYFTVVVILFIRLTYRFIKAYRWVKNPQNRLQACSFFNYIAVDEDLEGREAIMVHEQVHVQQGHSADVIFFELNAIINWFNPIAYLLKAESRKVHEYIADAAASETVSEKTAYAMLLFHENFGVKAQQLTNSFFNQSILKQRIMMLQKSKSKKVALLKYGFIAPLFLGMLVLSSAFVSKQTAHQAVKNVLNDTIPTQPIPQSIPKQDIPKILSNLPNGTIPSDKIIYIVNGKEVNSSEVRNIDVKNIESIAVIKGDEAKNKYGARAVEGAIEILLKKEGSETTFVNDSKKSIYLPKKDIKKAAPVLKVNGEKGKGGTIEVLSTQIKNNTENFPEKPLIVVDGKVMEAGFDMNTIKPTDIASVTILKDKSATTLYGEKAKEGVVQITLKKKN